MPIENLEQRMLFAVPNNYEQYLLCLVNRARANPAAEAARYGIALNEGLAAGTISTAASQPLAFNPKLIKAARGHSQWMISAATFSHTGANGSTPQQRMVSAGYTLTAPAGTGENIADVGFTNTYPESLWAANDIYKSLFVDSTEAGRGHRINILRPQYQESGNGLVQGVFNTSKVYYVQMFTQDFAYTKQNPFLTGVAFVDNVTADNFYTPGEGLGGVTITARRTSDNAVFSTQTWSTGGYSLQLAAGAYHVIASGGGLRGSIDYGIVAVGSSNVQLDVQAPSAPTLSAAGALLVNGTSGGDTISLTTSGANLVVNIDNWVYQYALSAVKSIEVHGYAGADIITLGTGVIGSTLYGEGGNDSITGGSGSDTIIGGGGNDTLHGNAGADSINGGAGNDLIYGDGGSDTLVGGAGADSLYGGAGNDVFYAADGVADRIDGGAGTNVLYADAKLDVWVNIQLLK